MVPGMGPRVGRPFFPEKCMALLFPWHASSCYTFFMTTLCPGCRCPTSRDSNPFHPFCSERCRVVDLGAWLNADYRIPEDFQRPPFIPIEEPSSNDP